MTSKKFENSITSLNDYKDINKTKEDRFSIDKYFVNNKEKFYYHVNYVQNYVLK